MKRRLGRVLSDLRAIQRGVAMVEATIGICLLLLVTLGALQIVLTLEASLEAHAVAARMARAYAITGDLQEAERVYNQEIANTLAQLKWLEHKCPTAMTCTVSVQVPELLPGSGLFIGDSHRLASVVVTKQGYYPNFERAN